MTLFESYNKKVIQIIARYTFDIKIQFLKL